MRNNWSASLVAAIFSIPMASAQPVQAQAPTQQGGPAVSSPDGTLRFEAVSVKLSAPSANAPVRQVRNIDPGRLRYVNIGLKDLVLEAYNLKAYQVVGPDWLGEIALDIDATMRPGLTKEQLRMMFENMLADRFKLTFHWDARELPAYSIVIASSGLKMKDPSRSRRPRIHPALGRLRQASMGPSSLIPTVFRSSLGHSAMAPAQS
ncbi:MAG TPA: TIGR03435 family protein [Bryobacteraceae bacterium]|nr:TIGR03435 family protein [Bryobacteraceae bacterium]